MKDFRRRKEAGRRSCSSPCCNEVRDPDETDSGLDIDALKIVPRGENTMRGTRARVFTDHALSETFELYRARSCSRDGRWPYCPSGGKELALELEERGYDWAEKIHGEPAFTR